MCTHHHTKNYFNKLPTTCQLAAYIALRKDQVAMEFDDLPVDGKGRCVFHSHDLKWKRAQRCGERFLDLCRAMASDETLTELDFREFWLTGANFGQKEGVVLENAYAGETVVLLGGLTIDKPIRLRGAKFCDALLLSDLVCVDIDFDEAVFKDVTTFLRCHFRDFTSFIGGCRFEHNLVIEDCVFEQLVSFDEAVWMQQLFVSQVDFKEGMVCPEAHQLANDVICQFSDVYFGAYTSFINAGFNAPLVFERCEFAGEAQFENTVLRGRFQLRNPSIQEKIFFVATKPGAKMFESAVDIELEEAKFGPFGQMIFQNANLFNANPIFKEQIRALELNHKIDIREGCLLYRTSIERVFPYSDLGKWLLEDLSSAFARFFESKYVRNLKVDVTRDLKQEVIRVIFHTDEAMTIPELEALLNLGKSDLLTFFSAPSDLAQPHSSSEVALDIWTQLQSLWLRFQQGKQNNLLRDFFTGGDAAVEAALSKQLNFTLTLNAKNVLIGNQIQAGGDVITGDIIHTGLPTDQARALAAHEVIDNLRQLDTHLQLIAHALQLNQEEAFTERFDALVRKYAPASALDPGNNLRQLMARTDAASLRHALNGHPLRQELGRALAEVLLKADLQHDSGTVADYLGQFGEIEWAEESLLNALASLADAGAAQTDTRRQQVVLGFSTIFNRAKLYHVYALRLLDALKPNAETLDKLQQLRSLWPQKPLAQPECNELLLGLVEEMTVLMQARAQLLQENTAERDQTLETAWAGIAQQTTLYPSDTWQEIIVKARILRDLGRKEEAIAAFEQYGTRFQEKFPYAAHYAQTAILLTQYIPEIEIKGGLYITSFEPNSQGQQSGLCIGDILVAMQDQAISGMDELLALLMKTPPNTPFLLKVLRWETTISNFRAFTFNVIEKPIGAEFLPV